MTAEDVDVPNKCWHRDLTWAGICSTKVYLCIADLVCRPCSAVMASKILRYCLTYGSVQRYHRRPGSSNIFTGGIEERVSRGVIVAAWVVPPRSLPPVDLAAQPDFSQIYVKFSHYGNQLIKNKDIVAEAARKAGATDSQHTLMMAIAMQVAPQLTKTILRWR